jgi:AraC-like DNA-binding protein
MGYDDPKHWTRIAQHLLRDVTLIPTEPANLVECEPEWSWDPELTDFDIWLPIRGRGVGTVNGETFALQPGTILVLRPADVGHFDHDPNDPLTVAYHHFCVRTADTLGPASLDSALLPSRRIRLAAPALQVEQMRSIIRLARDPHPLVTPQRIAALLTLVLDLYRQDAAQQGHPVTSVDPRIYRVVLRLQARPSQRLSLADAASIAGLSTAHFSRLFRASLGLSFREFALQARMDRARELLTETSLSVTQIARALGYQELYLFSRQVRARWGASPTDLRKASTTP